ncbi:hypothetical protein J2S66_000977 [Saccharothrix longispora]|uniref:Uncharacterized protein n=1 Tax=Saccharothrix longispora TaxID=33920 RepID=A0ABU1PPN0_9PSEU|nr:hypothetical protein [Saccharothrix longispora]
MALSAELPTAPADRVTPARWQASAKALAPRCAPWDTMDNASPNPLTWQADAACARWCATGWKRASTSCHPAAVGPDTTVRLLSTRSKQPGVRWTWRQASRRGRCRSTRDRITVV